MQVLKVCVPHTAAAKNACCGTDVWSILQATTVSPFQWHDTRSHMSAFDINKHPTTQLFIVHAISRQYKGTGILLAHLLQQLHPLAVHCPGAGQVAQVSALEGNLGDREKGGTK